MRLDLLPPPQSLEDNYIAGRFACSTRASPGQPIIGREVLDLRVEKAYEEEYGLPDEEPRNGRPKTNQR